MFKKMKVPWKKIMSSRLKFYSTNMVAPPLKKRNTMMKKESMEMDTTMKRHQLVVTDNTPSVKYRNIPPKSCKASTVVP